MGMQSTVPFKRKGHFIEVGYGKLGTDVQAEYEKAAEIACIRQAPVKVTLNITVIPPKEDNVGQVQYDLKTTLPVRKSIPYDAAYDKNVIIATASKDLGVLQTELYLPDPSETEKESVNG